jgi:hypothetical protein
MKPMGFVLVSTPLQAKRGNLVFQNPQTKEKWAIFKNGGYLRKWRDSGWREEWGVMHKTYEHGKPIEDDEYMDLVHLLSEKIRRSERTKQRKKERGGRISYINRVYDALRAEAESQTQHGFRRPIATKEEVKAAVKKLYQKYFPE